MLEAIVTGTALLLAALGEWLHARRCRRVAGLAFGPGRAPRAFARLAPALRALACGLLGFGLSTLLVLPPKVHKLGARSEGDLQHLVLVLDVSPSMRLVDAGPTQQQSRMRRAKDLLDSFFSRVSIDTYRLSVVATYNGAKPVVVDTSDLEVVRNILADLPMHYAFPSGQTDIFAGLREAARIAQPWRPKSAVVALISDGDTVPATGMPKMPASVRSVLVVGVGDPIVGRFIDGRQSRQDRSTLRQVAVRLHGIYHDGNTRHLSTETLELITQTAGESPFEKLTRREYALICCGLGAAILGLLPLLLHRYGTKWRPGVAATAPAAAGAAARMQEAG